MEAEPLTPAIVKETILRHWTERAAAYDEDTDHILKLSVEGQR